MKKILSLTLFILCILSVARLDGATKTLPDYVDYINDYANILSPETKNLLSILASQLEQKTTSQLAILTLDTIEPLDIESYAVKIFEKWGIGQKGKDNGVLLLVAIKERGVRIEVGYGLEGAIPDAIAKSIIEKNIIPYFRNGDFDTGILKGSTAIIKLIAKEYNVELDGLENIKIEMPDSRTSSFFDFLFIILFIIIIISLRSGFLWWWFFLPPSYRRRNGYWYGDGFGGNSGGFGGGFGGFGGGLSGGGGATGRW